MYSTICDFEVKNSGQLISSDSLKTCEDATWVVTAPLKHNIKLKFTNFQLSDSRQFGQKQLQIYDGKNTNGTSLGAFTGTKRPFSIQSSGRFMLIKLTHKGRSSSLCHFEGVSTFATAKGKLSLTRKLLEKIRLTQ